MQARKVDTTLISPELIFITSRSSGPGGQNVNKVNTKVTVKFDVLNSAILTEEEKRTISTKLASKLTTEGVLLISSQDKRSQLQNKDAVLKKLDHLFIKAFQKKKVRKTTKPSKSSIEERITKKKQQSEKKKWRQKLQ